MSSFNKEKFKQVLHYLIYKCGHLQNVGKTVLFKILYFSDFDHYELYEERLTGESYYKLPYGPAPSHFDEAVRELESEGKIKQLSATFGKHEQRKFLSIEEPDIILLSGREIGVIEKNATRFSIMNATQISEHSHSDMPYKATEEGDIIDYDLVFYRDEMFSVREYNFDDD